MNKFLAKRVAHLEGKVQSRCGVGVWTEKSLKQLKRPCIINIACERWRRQEQGSAGDWGCLGKGVEQNQNQHNQNNFHQLTASSFFFLRRSLRCFIFPVFLYPIFRLEFSRRFETAFGFRQNERENDPSGDDGFFFSVLLALD